MGRDGSSASGIFAATTRNECGNNDRKYKPTMISEWRFRFGLTCYISTIIPVRQSSSCVKYFQGFSATIFTVIRVYSALAFGPSHLPPPISATSRSLPSLLLQTSPFVSNNLNPFSQNNYRASPSSFFLPISGSSELFISSLQSNNHSTVCPRVSHRSSSTNPLPNPSLSLNFPSSSAFVRLSFCIHLR